MIFFAFNQMYFWKLLYRRCINDILCIINKLIFFLLTQIYNGRSKLSGNHNWVRRRRSRSARNRRKLFLTSRTVSARNWCQLRWDWPRLGFLFAMNESWYWRTHFSGSTTSWKGKWLFQPHFSRRTFSKYCRLF